MSKTKKDGTDYILSYYQKIKDGSVQVGQWIRMLYEFVVKSLEDKTLVFNQGKANDAIDWIEKHSFHTQGPKAPGSFELELWQKAIISCMFGLCDPKTGKRQFREIVVIMARKNGKSLFASAIAKYVMQVDGGYGAMIYCLAPKLEQAYIIYSNIWQMIQLDPEWKDLRDDIAASISGHNRKEMDDSGLIRKRVNDIYLPATNSSTKKIAFSAKKSDGFNPSLAICDEIASWEGDKGLKMYEVIKSGMGAREMGDNPAMLLSCSTSGYINDSIYDELIKRSTRFLLGESNEKRLLPFLYMIDDTEKWDDINELKKSNPNLGVSVSVDYLLEEIEIAKGSLSKKAEFMTKYCNVKQASSMAWLNANVIQKSVCGHEELEQFRGCYGVVGIDLSQTTDLTACVAVIEKDGVLHVLSQFFMPEERIDDKTAADNLPYRIYQQRGLLTGSGGNYVDYHDAYQWCVDLVEKYQIYPLVIGYDRYSAQYLVQDLDAYGFKTDDVFQGTNLTPVINEVDGLFRDGAFRIGDNDLMKVHMLNAAIKIDTEQNKKKLVKIAANSRIDGCAALLDAICVRQKYFNEMGDMLANRR